MKKYKFIVGQYPTETTKKLNKYIKQGWQLKEWKLNNNVVVVLLEKEVLL